MHKSKLTCIDYIQFLDGETEQVDCGSVIGLHTVYTRIPATDVMREL